MTENLYVGSRNFLGCQPDKHDRIDSWHQSADAMFSREMELIAVFGRRDLNRGPLANGNFGGTGMMGPSEETREKIRQAHKTRWTPEAREAMRQKALERYRNDPSLRLKIGAAQEGRWTKEERQKQAERAKLGILRPDVREKNVRIVKAIFADPVRLAAHADAAKRRAAQRPEIKKSLSVAQTENWKDPEYRARTIQSMNLSIAKRKAAQIPMGRTKKSVAS